MCHFSLQFRNACDARPFVSTTPLCPNPGKFRTDIGYLLFHIFYFHCEIRGCTLLLRNAATLFFDNDLLVLDCFQLLFGRQRKKCDDVLISDTEYITPVRADHFSWRGANNFRQQLLEFISNEAKACRVLVTAMPEVVRHRPHLAKDPQWTFSGHSSFVSLAMLERLFEIADVRFQS